MAGDDNNDSVAPKNEESTDIGTHASYEGRVCGYFTCVTSALDEWGQPEDVVDVGYTQARLGQND